MVFFRISDQNMGHILEKIHNKCIQMGYTSNVDQIKGQSITESLFMNKT